VGWHDKSW